jgi:hypothetical protein
MPFSALSLFRYLVFVVAYPWSSVCRLLLGGYLFGLLFGPEAETSAFIRNVRELYRTSRRHMLEDSMDR